jgi:hypothetical protein
MYFLYGVFPLSIFKTIPYRNLPSTGNVVVTASAVVYLQYKYNYNVFYFIVLLMFMLFYFIV